ncbi:protein of unknown function [Candidatus Filomicrobium marinum]|uniref:Uncharacterized protein n=1 Tax=Candidatus Filomicrobium marinum TaxID=1608628 RepID=A0A0D6JJK7_9HYPH|nr:protein of unknown function [Candidatus Filomicrobium marinum]
MALLRNIKRRFGWFSAGVSFRGYREVHIITYRIALHISRPCLGDRHNVSLKDLRR